MSDSAQQLIDNIAYKDEAISLRAVSITAIDIGAATMETDSSCPGSALIMLHRLNCISGSISGFSNILWAAASLSVSIAMYSTSGRLDNAKGHRAVTFGI